MPRIRPLIGCLIVAATATAAIPAVAQPVVLAPRIQLSQAERARLQVIADQGPEALRRFLWRTRMIYNWTWRDLVASE